MTPSSGYEIPTDYGQIFPQSSIIKHYVPETDKGKVMLDTIICWHFFPKQIHIIYLMYTD